MIDLVLVKKGMLCYAKAVRKIGSHVVMYKFRLVGAWIKRRKVVNGARSIISEKLKEHQYRGYFRSLESKR